MKHVIVVPVAVQELKDTSSASSHYRMVNAAMVRRVRNARVKVAVPQDVHAPMTIPCRLLTRPVVRQVRSVSKLE
ncbi:hypothetical protein EYB25_010037 [Talaromyces marneffei]|nr:hypothetical protein EYB25_010037 [Talaromyces marneffei]